MGKERINWSNVVNEAEKVATELYYRIGSPVTLRAIFYALVSRNIIPNTKSAYKRLSAVLTRARKEGRFSWHLIKDETRRILGGDYGYSLKDIEEKVGKIELEYIDDIIYELEKVKKARFSPSVKKWEGQKYRVIIALEKDALADAIHSMVYEWNVEILVMRGYASATSLYNLANKIKGLSRNGSKVVVLLLTDFDPSGEDIARYVRECLLNDFNVEAEVYKVAVTLEQIKKYDLPATPESIEERKKMARDPRFKKWEYGYFRVELDAMVGLVPEELKKILNQEISKYFDNEVYEKVKERVNELKEQGQKRLQELWNRLESVYKELIELKESLETHE